MNSNNSIVASFIMCSQMREDLESPRSPQCLPDDEVHVCCHACKEVPPSVELADRVTKYVRALPQFPVKQKCKESSNLTTPLSRPHRVFQWVTSRSWECSSSVRPHMSSVRELGCMVDERNGVEMRVRNAYLTHLRRHGYIHSTQAYICTCIESHTH